MVNEGGAQRRSEDPPRNEPPPPGTRDHNAINGLFAWQTAQPAVAYLRFVRPYWRWETLRVSSGIYIYIYTNINRFVANLCQAINRAVYRGPLAGVGVTETYPEASGTDTDGGWILVTRGMRVSVRFDHFPR